MSDGDQSAGLGGRSEVGGGVGGLERNIVAGHSPSELTVLNLEQPPQWTSGRLEQASDVVERGPVSQVPEPAGHRHWSGLETAEVETRAEVRTESRALKDGVRRELRLLSRGEHRSVPCGQRARGSGGGFASGTRERDRGIGDHGATHGLVSPGILRKASCTTGTTTYGHRCRW